MSKRREGIFIVGHGTKSNEGVKQFIETVNQVQDKSSLPVGFGFIELANPTIASGLEQFVNSSSVNHVKIVPLLLLAAGHVKNDIPDAISNARLSHPTLSFEISKDLSIAPILLEIIEDRVIESVSKFESRKPEFTLLVGRGSTDPDANSDLYKISRLLSERGRIGEVQPGFISLAKPDVPSSLNRLTKIGASEVVVAPYFLFSGALLDRIYNQSKAWSASNPGTKILLAAEMGSDERISDLIIERIESPIVDMMNCEMCIYRTKFPNNEMQKRGMEIHADHLHG